MLTKESSFPAHPHSDHVPVPDIMGILAFCLNLIAVALMFRLKPKVSVRRAEEHLTKESQQSTCWRLQPAYLILIQSL